MSLSTSKKNLGLKNDESDRGFGQWLSSFNVQTKYLSEGCDSKLKALHLLNVDADSIVEDVIKIIKKCEQEYEALAKKNISQLQLLGLNVDDFDCETERLLQESCDIVMEGNVGDGTEAGAASTLAMDFLTQTDVCRQKLNLLRDIRSFQKKNGNLKENIQFFEREAKCAQEELSVLQAEIGGDSMNLDASLANHSKLTLTTTSVKAELEELGVSSSISTDVILDSFKELKSIEGEISALEQKLKKYGELPPSIPDAVKVVEKTRDMLTSLSNEVKARVTSSIMNKKL